MSVVSRDAARGAAAFGDLPDPTAESVSVAFLQGGGQMGALMRAYDWSRTSLGPISVWPQSLKTTVGILLRSPVPIVLLWGPDGVMIYNDAYSVFAESRHPQLLGSKVREGWPEVADFNDNVMKVGLSGGTLSYQDQELTLYRKGVPEQVWMNLDYSPVLDESGEPAGVLAVVVETTERVQAERALARTQERLSYALNASGMVGTFDWYIQSDTFYSDPRFAAMYSVDPDKGARGTPIADYLAGIHPDDIDRVREAVNHTIATGEKYVQEYRLLQKDGTIRWIEARGECLYDDQGKPLRFPGAVVDITERKQAAMALRDSERHVSELLEALPAAIYTTDAAGRITFYNQAAIDLSGRRPMLGSDQWCVSWKLYHPDGTPLPHDQCPMALALKENRPIRGREAIAERPDGTRVPFIPYPTPLYDASGRLVGAVNMLVDISDRKRAEDALRESEERLRVLFEQTTGGIAQVDTTGRFTMVNQRYCDIVGYSADELLGMRMQDITHPDDRPANVARFQKLVEAGESFVIEKRYLRKDGSPVWVNNSVAPIRDAAGRVQQVVAMVIDITERKRVEEVERQLAAIIESSDDAIVSKNLSSVIASWNQGAERLFGYRAEEVIGKPITILIPEDRQDEEPGILERIRRGERVEHYETIRRRKDGSLVEVSLAISPVRDAQGRIIGASKIARDITGRKQAERLQRILMHELKHRVKNILATVQAIARQTFSSRQEDSTARETFDARLLALSNAHDLLTRENWDSAELSEVVAEALAPYRRERFEIDGPGLRLTPRMAVALTLALHELATNAAKYGALSVPTGRIAITWAVLPGDPPQLAFRWQERGGPLVTPPSRKGFGSRLIERSLAMELAGDVQITYDPAGVVCDVNAPLADERETVVEDAA